MWRDNHNYFLRLRIRVLGHNETVVLRHTEGRSCSWTSSTCWFRHWIAEQRRRCKCRYWVVSRGNASKVWKTICILCKILPFLGSSNYMFSLQISFGTLHWPSVSGYVDELIEALIEKKAPFVRWQLLPICDSTSLTQSSDSCSCVPTCQIIGAADRKDQVIRSGNANFMVPTAIHFESPGIIYIPKLYLYLSWAE